MTVPLDGLLCQYARMQAHDAGKLDDIRLLQTTAHDCGYYDDREAKNLVIDPLSQPPAQVYDFLIRIGFRRSGEHIYRPHCAHCNACTPTRLPVAMFTPNRSQKRCRRRNADLAVATQPAGYEDEIFDLYRCYLNHRHADGGMDQPAREDFEAFLCGRWARSAFLMCRDPGGRLLAVAATDRVADGLSAVYTFFDPEQRQRGLGTFGILAQIDLARTLKLPYVYLGYWIDQHPKMNYKRFFRPLDVLRRGRWERLD